MKDQLNKLKKSFEKELAKAKSGEALESLRVGFFGKKGELTSALRSVGQLKPEERPAFGQAVNALREKLEAHLTQKIADIRGKERDASIAGESVDVTLPGRMRKQGTLHPLTLMQRDLVRAFSKLGFVIADGPEIETDHYNFESLNFPKDHPSRDMQDTLFLKNELLLRTHTSPVQIRMMEKVKPPFRLIIPGRVYRHDSDSTHSPVFHQIEGLVVGEDIHFGHLKGTLEAFLRDIFGESIQTRFRPSFFPFTEPSAEVDLAFGQTPKGEEPNWMEILGCGMVDPNVFEGIGKIWNDRDGSSPYDPEKISGFAFGLGIERMAMVNYQISQIRLFFENDLRFLNQFRGPR